MFFITFHAHPAFGVPVIVASYSILEDACSSARTLHELSNCPHLIKVVDSSLMDFDDNCVDRIKLVLSLE